MTLYEWLTTLCIGWVFVGAIIMAVGIALAPRRDDWD